MGPRPLRQPTRKSAASAPRTLAAQLLHDLAQSQANSEAPQLAAVLGKRSLQVACGHHGALSRKQTARICKHCGVPLALNVEGLSVKAVKLSSRARRRRVRQVKKNNDSGRQQQQAESAAVVTLCAHCDHSTVKRYETLVAAQNVVAQTQSKKAAE